MARRARFEVSKTDKGWLVNVPPSVSDTGKRQQRYFTTRAKADEFASSLKTGLKEFGERVRTLSPGAMEDAASAMKVLLPWGVSLATAARFYVESHDARSKAPTLSEAWDSAIKTRSGLSERYQKNLRSWRNRLPEYIADKNIVDISPADIAALLDQVTNGSTAWKTGLGILSVVLGDQVKRSTLSKNPCESVESPKVRSTDEVMIFTVKQLKALFAACKDYDKDKDKRCSECAVPFAFLAFAGIRPTELTRLRWEDVKLESDNIRLSGRVTKTGKTRNVRINPTMRAWIETIPDSKRFGRIIPGRWIQKATRVRLEAKLDGRELQDALRHSFGSYLLAVENDINLLRADMGHQHADTFFTHYHNALTPEEANPYWKILPPN